MTEHIFSMAAEYTVLTLLGRVARTAYHEKPSVFPGGTPGVT